MKITMIHGQSHRGSSCHIGQLLAAQFPGSELSEFFLPRELNHFCLGCYACLEDETKCPCYAEKKRIMDEVERADLLIFTTPTYCMHASAPMKALIDLNFSRWMSHKPRACMFSKRAVVISTAAGAGTRSAIKDVTTMLFHWGVPWVKTFGISVQAMCWEQVSDRKKAKIERKIGMLASAIKRKKTVRVGLKTRFMFGLMRMMQKKGWGASPKEKEYWEKNGWLASGRPWKDTQRSAQ